MTLEEQEALLQKQISRLKDPNEKLIKEYIKYLIVVGNEDLNILLYLLSPLFPLLKLLTTLKNL
jgi:hypothetical protein